MHWRFKPSSGLATDCLPLFEVVRATPLVAGSGPVKWRTRSPAILSNGRTDRRSTPQVEQRVRGFKRVTTRRAHDNDPRGRWGRLGFVTVPHAQSAPSPVAAGPGLPLRGRLRAPGDKSISHRALILGLLAIGETRIEGLLEGDDVLRTAGACRALGAGVTREAEGRWRVRGAGVGGLTEPAGALDFGNAGTGARLMMGVAGSHPITATFDGDASLRKRPMRRILDPLVQMGVTVVDEAEGGRVPLTLRGPRETIPIAYETPAASAQIKSAVLLAGLNAPGRTTVVEREATRDHTERMLRHFGADVTAEPHGPHGRTVALQGHRGLRSTRVVVPSDPSSAAFPLV